MTATLSSCLLYRYRLQRQIDLLGGKTIAYFGINPSTADAVEDDATVKKWRGFSTRNNAKQFVVANVFAYRTKDVKQLAYVDDPVGPENEKYVQSVIHESDILVPCWGSRKKIPKVLWKHIDIFMLSILSANKPVYCFGKTKSGDPMHPLMIGYDKRLTEWE